MAAQFMANGGEDDDNEANIDDDDDESDGRSSRKIIRGKFLEKKSLEKQFQKTRRITMKTIPIVVNESKA